MTMYKIWSSPKFKKDLRRIAKRGYDTDRLQEAIDLLASGELMPKRYKDHALQGNWVGFRECHISADWLLVYKKINSDKLILALSRTGTHVDLFKK